MRHRRIFLALGLLAVACLVFHALDTDHVHPRWMGDRERASLHGIEDKMWLLATLLAACLAAGVVVRAALGPAAALVQLRASEASLPPDPLSRMLSAGRLHPRIPGLSRGSLFVH